MNNNYNCFIDFDGTIVCNKKRLYSFFIDNIDKLYSNALTIDEFWSLKKMGINEIDWINQKYNTSIDKNNWDNIKIQQIESEYYLKYNQLFIYSAEALNKIRQSYNLVLVTRRSNKENFWKEIKSYNIEKNFDNILIIDHNNEGKANIIKRYYKINCNDILIGDTEDDMKAAVDLNITGIFVKSGIRSEWILKKYFSNYNKILCYKDINQIDFYKLKNKRR